MRAIRFPGNRRTEVVDVPVPAPGPGEVRIRVHASAICGTDLHQYRQSVEGRGTAAKLVTGHEPVGEVQLTGPGVAWPTIGDRVVAYHVVGCGTCDTCRVGVIKRCIPDRKPGPMGGKRHGANADYIIVPAHQCLPLPDTFSWDEGAVLACNFGTAYGAIAKLPSTMSGPLAVFGLGPVGLSVVLIGVALGIPVIGVDPSKGRRDLAATLGASDVLDPYHQDLTSCQSHWEVDSMPYIIETSGAPAAHQILVDVIRPEGTVVLVGIGQGSSIGPTPSLIIKEVIVKGSWIYELSDWTDILEFCKSRRVDLQAIISHRSRPENAPAMYRVADQSDTGKVVFHWKESNGGGG